MGLSGRWCVGLDRIFTTGPSVPCESVMSAINKLGKRALDVESCTIVAQNVATRIGSSTRKSASCTASKVGMQSELAF